jgi:hypothetical protein
MGLRFLVHCVGAYSDAEGVRRDEGFEILSRYGVLDYLLESYEPLHTQGRLNILTEIVEMLIERGYYPKDSTPYDIIPEYKAMEVQEA